MADVSEKSTQRAARDKRLAAALRQNLRRRKAQVRARAEAEPPEGDKPEEKPARG